MMKLQKNVILGEFLIAASLGIAALSEAKTGNYLGAVSLGIAAFVAAGNGLQRRVILSEEKKEVLRHSSPTPPRQ